MVGMDAHDDGYHLEHDPTITWEPGADRPTTGPSGREVEGVFGWALVVESGPRAGLTYVLGAGETLVGRDADSDIFLGDVTVSRRHARFILDEHGLRVEDLGSTNGTYVNDHRGDAFMLSPKDEVRIGKHLLLVVQGRG
ncbi:MAG: FHA domain-containing protein [Actinobacteria bacterium]|nr:MAG: FHA domain-containing protein [Actinomycetota bacterium]